MFSCRHFIVMSLCFLTGQLSLSAQDKSRNAPTVTQSKAAPANAKEVGEPKPGEERSFEIAKGVKMVFCWIPKGECQLGSPKAERDEVLKQVGNDDYWQQRMKEESEEVRGKYKSKGFWLGKYTVTQEEWTSVTSITLFSFHKNGEWADDVKGIDTSRFPAESISWNECQGFLKKLNRMEGSTKLFGKPGVFVLPHEDEWEYACRGGKGNQRAYYWGNSLNGDKANCGGKDPFGTDIEGVYKGRPMPVGSFEKAAKHPWNLCDMHGNMWQWCENLYDSKDDDFECRVLRGGSWCFFPYNCRSAFRYYNDPNDGFDGTGFRVCFRPN